MTDSPHDFVPCKCNPNVCILQPVWTGQERRNPSGEEGISSEGGRQDDSFVLQEVDRAKARKAKEMTIYYQTLSDERARGKDARRRVLFFVQSKQTGMVGRFEPVTLEEAAKTLREEAKELEEKLSRYVVIEEVMPTESYDKNSTRVNNTEIRIRSLKSAAEQLERYSKVIAKQKEVVAKDFWTYEDETVTRGELSFNRLTWTFDKCGSEDATYLRPVYPEQALARYKHAFKCNNCGEEYVK